MVLLTSKFTSYNRVFKHILFSTFYSIHSVNRVSFDIPKGLMQLPAITPITAYVATLHMKKINNICEVVQTLTTTSMGILS